MIEFAGVVTECLPDARFLVQISGTERVVNAYPSGRMRKNHIRILAGDKVTLEMSPYDKTIARITFRDKA